MNFDEWWTKNYPDGTAFTTAEAAWKAALDEAIHVAAGFGEFGEHVAAAIAKLKEPRP